MKKIRLYIVRNMTHTAPVEVPEWEVRILNMIHGRENVKRLAEVHCDVEIPSVMAEAERLTERYGKHEESGVPHFVRAYGAEDTGLDMLADAMAKVVGKSKIVMVKPSEEFVDTWANPEPPAKEVEKGAKAAA